jgi:hypothetical protein
MVAAAANAAARRLDKVIREEGPPDKGGSSFLSERKEAKWKTTTKAKIPKNETPPIMNR